MDRQTDLYKRQIKAQNTGLYIHQYQDKFFYTHYYLSLIPFHFEIRKSVYEAIRDCLKKYGDQVQFRVYYMPESREFLSVEFVDQM